MSEKVVYTGHFLTNPEELLAQLPPQIVDNGSRIHAHHVTKEFAPVNGKEDIVLGRERELHVTGHVIADGVHAALVESPDGESLTENQHANEPISNLLS